MVKNTSNVSKKISLLPIVFALGFIPLLVHSHVYHTGLTIFDWFPESADTQIDFFLYYKMIAIIVTAVIMIGFLVYQYSKQRKKSKVPAMWLSLGAYGLFVFLSGLFSSYRSFAFMGSYELFESVLAILGYVIICFYSFQTIQNEEDLIFVGKYAGIGIAIVTLIGFFQFFGLDLFRTNFGKMLITSSSIRNALGDLSFTFPSGTSYTTLYNTNYLAFYYGLIIPILVILLLFSKKATHKILFAVMTVVSFITLIGSNSKSALLALGVTFVIGMLILHKYLKKYFWVPLLAILAMLGLIGAYSYHIGGFQNLYNGIFVGVESDASQYAIKNIGTLDDEIVFYLQNGKELHAQYTGAEDTGIEITATDASGASLSSHSEDGLTMIIDDSDYLNCTLTPVYVEDILSLKITMDELDWVFTNQTDGTYYFFNSAGKLSKIPEVQKSELFPDNIFSGRGNLWNYILPKLKSCILFGTGANTFAMVYPNDNYVTKVYNQTSGLFDVKAHNLYLQQFLENGLFALLLLIAFYLWYFVESVKLYTKISEYTVSSMLGLGILLGTFDYMIIGIANDSNVCTAPVYWVLLGSGIAINSMLKKEIGYEKH